MSKIIIAQNIPQTGLDHTNTRLAKFIDLGLKASYHYADDSGSEWGLGRAAQNQAEALYAEASATEKLVMAKESKQFLWALKE